MPSCATLFGDEGFCQTNLKVAFRFKVSLIVVNDMERDFNMRLVASVAVVLLWSVSAGLADVQARVEALFAQDMASIDLARVKIEVDQIIDPSISVDTQLAQIDEMVATIRTLLPANADSWDKAEAVRKFIYDSGPWNDNRPFAYDLEDPFGLDVSNKLLADYIADRRGNCITMPFLFIILGQRLGIDVRPSLAPLHVFVKFTDEAGTVTNLETTSGALPARDVHYRNQLPMTDEAVANGVFLAELSQEETVAVIATVLVEDLIRRERYIEAIAVADTILAHYPNFAYLMVKKGTAAYYLLKRDFYSKYPTATEIPEAEHAYLAYLQNVNQSTFNTAEALGWRALEQ